MPSSLTNYRQWMQSHDLSITVDELPDGAHLLWISAKRVDRANLYALSWYGTLLYQMSSEQLKINTVGPYMMSCAGNVMTFCRYLQVELEERNIYVSIAISFNLELLPNNPFPAQLPGAQAAISTLLSAGAKPQNITLAGASAGGNLILQLLTHILHPLPTVTPLRFPLSTPFRGVFLMSPWVSMQEDLTLPQHLLDAKQQYDSLSSHLACRTILNNVPITHIPFVDPLEAPEDQFDGLSRLAGRGFVIWGEV
ncbi:hypothetical protein EDD18DRAFT_1193777, partial [Armillaria luteobubalina]